MDSYWCQGQDKRFSQGQELGQAPENAHMEVVMSLGLPGSISLSCHLSLPCFRLPECFHLHNPGLITRCTFVKNPLSLLPGGE